MPVEKGHKYIDICIRIRYSYICWQVKLLCWYFISSLPRRNCRNFADDTFGCIFMNIFFLISIRISLEFVLECAMNNKSTLILAMTWRRKEISSHDDVIKWKHFPRYWPFVRGIHRFPVNSPHKGQWRGALMFSLICVWINGWVNNREAGDLRRYFPHYDVTVMVIYTYMCVSLCVYDIYL